MRHRIRRWSGPIGDLVRQLVHYSTPQAARETSNQVSIHVTIQPLRSTWTLDHSLQFLFLIPTSFLDSEATQATPSAWRFFSSPSGWFDFSCKAVGARYSPSAIGTVVMATCGFRFQLLCPETGRSVWMCPYPFSVLPLLSFVPRLSIAL